MPAYQLDKWKSANGQRGNRFYRCEITQDLFGNWLVVRRWGAIDSRRWGSKDEVCQDYAEAQKLFGAVAKRREKRQYIPIGENQW